MLGFDQEFQNGTSKITKIWLNFTLSDGTSLEYHEDRVLFNGFTRDTSTTVDGEFTVGAAVTGKLSVSLDNSDDALSGYDFRGATIVAWLGGIKSDESIEKVNVGRYYVDEYTYDGNNISLTAYDDMSQFDVPCKNTSVSWPSSGKTIAELVSNALSVTTDLGLWNASLPGPSGYKVTKKPEQWKTMTWHDVIAYCAQIMCCYAQIVYVSGQYKLKFAWYDLGSIGSTNYDGGTFNTTTVPYSDGAELDGGSFNPWNTGDVADGGVFGDRANLHVIGMPYDMTVDTDDVLITGTSVTLAASDNINADDDTEDYTVTEGSAGYIISISGNPLIETTGQADTVASYINTYVSGMRFRPLAASCVENPSMEAGDTALIPDRKDNLYACFLSRVTYTVNGATQVSCDAQSTMQNLKGRYTGAQKTQAMMQRAFDRSVSNTETAMHSILSAYAASMGLYDISYQDQGGATIYQYGDHATQQMSTIIWRLSAGALTVSSDGGQTWNAALSMDGTAVLQRLYAIGIDADYINTGTLTVGGDAHGIGTINIKDNAGNTLGVIDEYGIHYGKDSVSDDNETGFYLSSDGFTVGDADNDLYFRVLLSGDPFADLVAIRDNPYPFGDTSIARTTFSIFSDHGTTNLGSVYSAFSGDVDIGGDCYVEGDLTVDGTFYNFSDRRLKEHVDYLGDDALKFIRQLKPVHYKRKGNSEVGFYAQDVEKVDQWECMTGENKGHKTLNYIEIIAPLVKYCQSLEKRIEELEGRINGHSE